MNFGNYNTLILDAENLTITAGELMRLADSALVLMVTIESEENDGVVSTRTHVDRLIIVYYSESDGYTFVFGSGGSDSPLVYVAGDAGDVIALE